MFTVALYMLYYARRHIDRNQAAASQAPNTVSRTAWTGGRQ
jgi:hypothetical protein